VRVSFDIGGVLSKYPGIFLPLMRALAAGGVECHVVTDMHDRPRSLAMLRANGIGPDLVPDDRLHNSSYDEHGELCKAVVLRQLGIDVHIDDFPGYCTGGAGVTLFVWPQPALSYYHDTWQTDGSEGNFGRRRPRNSAGDLEPRNGNPMKSPVAVVRSAESEVLP
jgi:hypothetical protein